MKKISIILMVLVVALASCKKTPEVNLKYVDVERDLVTVGTTTANIQCDYKYITALKKAYLYYGEGDYEPIMTSAEMRVVQNTLYVELTGLKENTAYSYYYEFHNGFNSMRTALKTFKTDAGNGGGEEPPTPETTLPTVITAEVTEITTNSAQCGGEVTNDGGNEVTERGICWSTIDNPTLDDSHVAAGTGTGAFTASMSGLEANTTYHARAYAINERGTAYGLDKEFTTLSGGGSGIPEGAINGLFTINENGDQVYFSQGNLQYQPSSNTWKFAEHQYDLLITPEELTSWHEVYGAAVDVTAQYNSMFNGWIDLFGWGTSGWDNGNVYFQPYDFEALHGFPTYYLYGFGYGPTDGTNYDYDLTDTYSNADWGIYNSISNGGNESGLWRTLTMEEWVVVLTRRNTISNILYAKAQVNGVNGFILLPDDWNAAIFTLNNTNMPSITWNSNIVTSADWSNILEVNGAVFLPAAGSRDGNMVGNVNESGEYWSVSSYHHSVADAWQVLFGGDGGGGLEVTVGGRPLGKSVRLVRNANP